MMMGLDRGKVKEEVTMATGRPNIETIEAADYEGGCNYNRDLTSLAANESPNSMNVVFGDSIKKRDGYKEMYSTSASPGGKAHSMMDFGISATSRQLVTHFGSSVFSMSNLDGTMTSINSGVSNVSSYNAIVKQLLIQTYSDNSQEYYWTGSSALMAPLSASSPGFMHTIEYQGYLLGGNISTARLRIYYEDINTMIDGTYADYFTLTGGKDDGITQFFLINGRCYVGTSGGIFRLSYIGGLAVFEYKNIVSDVGIIPKSLKVVITKEYGQIALFLGTDKNLYLFDGSFIQNISEKFRFSNNDTAFSLQDIDDTYIELNTDSMYDTITQTYRLVVTPKGSNTNKIAVNIDVETLAYYPFDNMTFGAVVMARDNLNRRFILGADYNGKVHKLFRNAINDNGVAIREYYESPLIMSRSPHMKKPRTIDLHFEPAANYKLKYSDRTDYDKTWKSRAPLEMYKNRDKFLGQNTSLAENFKLGSEVSVVAKKVNVPVMENAYRYRLETDGGDADTICSYTVGTVSGTGGGTTVTATGGAAWTSDMTVDNDYRIWIKDGDHANTSYTFEYVSATSGTVSTMVAGNFSGASYEIYKTGCAICSKPWELLKMEYNTEILSIGKTEIQR